jgi:dienelactone hydrolase
MNRTIAAAALGSLFFTASQAPADGAASRRAVEAGTVHFKPAGDQNNVPERYRLQPHDFSYRMEKIDDRPLIGVEVYHLTFPSPVESPCKENNTVHAEYYRPKGRGPFPCAIVLDITGGDQSLSRMIANHLAQNKIGGLFVQMAYYGPRRPKGSSLRLLSLDLGHTMKAIRQTVLDLRRATAWMESRPEIDPARLGVSGTSLGSFIAALTAEMEPKLKRVVVLLGGAGFVDGYYDHPKAKNAVKVWEALGGTKQKVKDLIAPVDPITCAANLKDRKLLIIAGKKDEIVPPKMAEALWKATGQQKIVWYNCGHYTAAVYLLPALKQVVEHLGAK